MDQACSVAMAEMVAFTYSPAADIHASWWEPDWLPLELFERLRANRGSRRHLSSYLLQQLELADNAVPDPAAPEAHLMLMPGHRLDRLVVLAGVTLLSASIARVLRGRDRSTIKAAIGADDYEFALKRGRLLLQQARLRQHETDFRLCDFGRADESCRRAGVGALATALQRAPRGVIRRVQIKLRKEWVELHWTPIGSGVEQFQGLFRQLDRQVRAA